MPTPPPEPNGRPSSPHPAPGSASGDARKASEADEAALNSCHASGSTGSHHPAQQAEPLSDILRKSGSSRRVSTAGSDLLKMLGSPGASPIVPAGTEKPANTDDAPTIITRNHGPAPAPTPLAVTGDPPTVAGRRLGHFELIEAIGSGGMAAVLKARDLELGRVVALKILPPETARDAEGVDRFKQEARAAAMLDHENVARVYFCGEDQGLHFIAFEFVEGVNLRQLIDQRGTIPPAECVRYMIQVAAGLNHAAERGVVHRDIKPSNILITPDGRAKIVDMGLARHLDAVNGGLTHSGVTLGTFDYISPEQALDPRRADVRSDIYSLGCAFYHALTGRPPVPEGTAAMKLQAHQHIDPLDPREINPSIPDDLAVILAGMMAKDPDQRYQTPTDLIAHLKGLAERLKVPLEAVASDSAVQAVPASQAIRPAPRRLQLGWAVAIAAVAIAIAAFALSPGNRDGRQAFPPWAMESTPKTPPPIGSNGDTANSSHQTGDGVVAVRTVQQLAEALANPKTKQVFLDPITYDLTTLPEGIAFAGDELELRGSSSPAGATKLVVFAAHNSNPNTRPAGSLTIKADKFTLRGVRVEYLAPQVSGELTEGNATHPVGIAVYAATEVHLIDSTFTSQDQAEDEAVAVAVDSPRTTVRVERCAFGHGKDVTRGGIALQVPARAIVEIDDSGFGPHSKAVQILAARDESGDSALPAATVRLMRSSFMLDPQCVAVSSASPVAVTAQYCVFAAGGAVPTTPPTDPFGTVLQVAKADGVKFTGSQKNAYYRVKPFAVGNGESAKHYTFDECKDKFPVADLGAVTLAQRPWAETKPLDVLADAEPWRAFRLKLADPAVFVPKDPVVRVIGAQFHNDRMVPGRRAYPELSWPPELASNGEARQLVWYPYPNPKDGEPLPKDTFSDLRSLLRAARSGDMILIRHSGPLPMVESPIKLNARGAADFKLTFKPFPGSKPILTADPDERALDQPFFRLLSGEVAFDGVQFLLKPSRPKSPQTVAAIAIVGGKGCTFTNCTFTLAEEDESRAVAVLVSDPDREMAMDGTSRPTPDVKFDRCVIRGKGRGVWTTASRPVKVDVGHSLTAIDGPLFLAEPVGKMPATAHSTLKLTRVTAFAGGPIVELRGGAKTTAMGTSGLAPVDVEANECLFAAVPGAGQPLVEFDGIDAAEAKTVLTWQVQKGNRYANFDAAAAVMLVRPGGDGSTPKEWNWSQWIDFAGEPPAAGKPLGKLFFEKPVTGLRDLAALKPSDIAVEKLDFPELIETPKPGDTGADPKTLPAPFEDEPKPE